jgi:trehalose 6-phosphate phosphatase
MTGVTTGADRASLPAFSRTALLLDLDGTLLDLAPAPDLVVVPAELPGHLLALREALGGALGVISGRPIAQVDALLPGIVTAVAGEHGAALRPAPGAPERRTELPSAPTAWLDQATRMVAAHPGAMLEPKSRGFVVHYRLAPSSGAVLEEGLRDLLRADPRFELLPAAMAWEIRPRGVDKGRALKTLMTLPPFAGLLPLFIGDDVTDDDAVLAALALGGAGLKVDTTFGTPGGVRAWLGRAAQGAAQGAALGRGAQTIGTEDVWPGW